MNNKILLLKRIKYNDKDIVFYAVNKDNYVDIYTSYIINNQLVKINNEEDLIWAYDYVNKIIDSGV